MKNPNSKLTNMRLDLEEFDFVVEYIQGKANVIADALSRIVTTSDELKNMNILKVNTRAMTRKQKQTTSTTETPEVAIRKEPDHLSTYVTENPSMTNKLHKLAFRHDKNVLEMIILSKNSKKLVASVQQQFIVNGSHTLGFALLKLEKYYFRKKLKRLLYLRIINFSNYGR